jgi:hypothetical protein
MGGEKNRSIGNLTGVSVFDTSESLTGFQASGFHAGAIFTGGGEQILTGV